MIWLFERDDESLRIETRFDNDTSEYVAIVHYPDGQQLTKRFDDADAYGTWLEQFEQSLEAGDWARNKGGPVFLPDGWPNKRPS